MRRAGARNVAQDLRLVAACLVPLLLASCAQARFFAKEPETQRREDPKQPAVAHEPAKPTQPTVTAVTPSGPSTGGGTPTVIVPTDGRPPISVPGDLPDGVVVVVPPSSGKPPADPSPPPGVKPPSDPVSPPPGVTPPSESDDPPPGVTPPTESNDPPPGVTPPGDNPPPGVTPPGDDPPGVTPPGDDPPGVTPPGDDPPGTTPPGDDIPPPPGTTPDTPDTPLALDLDHDGKIAVATHTVAFDLDADGHAEARAWIGASDGWLVLDRNGNGRIDDGRELFGSFTLIGDKTAKDGFEALAALDSDKDGDIDADDASFAALRIWRDANQDGKSTPDELKTLPEAGVKALKLEAKRFDSMPAIDAKGRVRVLLEGQFVATDGSVQKLVDVVLSKGEEK